MNQNFSFKRYVWLLKRQWYENAAIYKLGILLMMLVTCVLFWLFCDWKPYGDIQQTRFKDAPVFLVTVIIFMYIYAAWFFDSLSLKNKKMFYFSLPVSPLERITVTFTFVMVLVPFVLLTVFIIFDFMAIQLFNHIYGGSEQMFFQQIFDPSSRNFMPKEIAFLLLFVHLLIVSIFTLGSLMFGKKGPVISIVFMIGCSYILYKFLNLFLYVFLNTNVNDVNDGALYNIFLCTSFFIFSLCWIMMYFTMKRKEA